MPNPFAVFADAINKAMRYVGTDLNDAAAFQRLGPNFREKLAAERSTALSTVDRNEVEGAKGRLTLADQLASLIGPQVGQVEALRDLPPMTFGAEDGGAGYAANMPSPAEPDYAAMMPPRAVEATGMMPESIVGLARGKEARRMEEGKRALAILRGDQSLAAIEARNAGAESRDSRRQAFQRSLEEFKQAGRGDIARLTAGLRQKLAEYNQGQQNARFREGLDSSEARFYDRLNQSASQWEQSQDLREMSARRQVLSAQLDREANLSPEGRAQIIFELGIINGRLANMGLAPSVVTPQAQPATPGGPPDSASSTVPNPQTPEVPAWVAAIVRKGSAATPEERQRVAVWRASVAR